MSLQERHYISFSLIGYCYLIDILVFFFSMHNFSCCRATAISEEQARDALLAFVAEHCCFGKKAAEDMEIKDITPSSAYHVSMSQQITLIVSPMPMLSTCKIESSVLMAGKCLILD